MAIMDIFPALFDNHFIKVIFLVHSALTCMAVIGSYNNGLSNVYSHYNGLFLVAILLSMLVGRNTDIILTATVYNLVCILLDILVVIGYSNIGTLTILIIVLNLILRPVSSIMLLKNYTDRAGLDDPTSGLLEVNVPNATPASSSRSAYQNIDESNQALP